MDARRVHVYLLDASEISSGTSDKCFEEMGDERYESSILCRFATTGDPSANIRSQAYVNGPEYPLMPATDIVKQVMNPQIYRCYAVSDALDRSARLTSESV